MVVAITGLGITHTGAPLPSERPTWRATASRPGPAIEGREHVADGDSAAQARAKRRLNSAVIKRLFQFFSTSSTVIPTGHVESK